MQDDHDMELLYANNGGRAYLCRHCGQYQVVFGNMLIHCTAKNFRDFCYFVEHLDLSDDRLFLTSDRQRVVFRISEQSPSCYCFSLTELEGIRDLLNGTRAMIELQTILQFNSIKN